MHWIDWQDDILSDIQKLCYNDTLESRARYVKQTYKIVQNIRQQMTNLDFKKSNVRVILVSSNLDHFLSQITNTATLDYLSDLEFKMYMCYLIKNLVIALEEFVFLQEE